VRLGYVYGNLMVNLHQKNSKLAERAVTIVERALEVDRTQARMLLRAAGSSVPTAIVMHSAGVTRKRAETALAEAGGRVRKAIAIAGGLQ
jgi:N-acetylmuramic acid 6-phosphate etherase